jgi:hypothetical protein
MGIIVEQTGRGEDWIDRWECLVQYGSMHADFTGVFLDLAKIQADKHFELRGALEKIENQKNQYLKNENLDRKRRFEEKSQNDARERHNWFQQIKNELTKGNHLKATEDIAKAYLGLFYDIDESLAPEDRVAALVGQKLQQIAIESLSATIKKNAIPTPRQISDLHANENKEYRLEHILVAQADFSFRADPKLSDISIAIAQSTLASFHWELYASSRIGTECQKRLQKIVFADPKLKEDFIRDTIEPYLRVGKTHVSGLYRISRNLEFSDIAGKLALEWISTFEKMSNESLAELLSAAIQYAPRKELVELVEKNVSAKAWRSDEKRREIWLSALFLLNFEVHAGLLSAYASEDPSRIWPFRDIVAGETRNRQAWPRLSDLQNHFLINIFGPHWPPVEMPSGWSGNQNPWDGAEFIQGRIADLASNLSERASNLLEELIEKKELVGFRDYSKHLLSQQSRMRAEAGKAILSLADVRRVLLESSPANHEDLQALIVDQLEGLQNRLRNSPTNDVDAFWYNDGPRGENYCRDRITTYLDPFVGRYGVRVHTEGTMPSNKRCDLLSTYGAINLPMEIKGQWHPDLWAAGSDQLGNYTKEYRAEGWGIYLILWFGYLSPGHSKNPHGWEGQPLPKTLAELKQLVKINYSQISNKTKIFILDLSKL